MQRNIIPLATSPRLEVIVIARAHKTGILSATSSYRYYYYCINEPCISHFLTTLVGSPSQISGVQIRCEWCVRFFIMARPISHGPVVLGFYFYITASFPRLI